MKMTKEEFLFLLHKAGFKNKREFAEFVNLPYASVNNWGNVADYPKYCKALLNALVKSKEYDLLLSDNKIFSDYKKLKDENQFLKMKLRDLGCEI